MITNQYVIVMGIEILGTWL